MKRFGTYIGAICVACLVSAPFGGTAYAADIAQLDANYQMAVQAYEEAVVERQQNADEIALVEASIEHTEALLTDTRNRLGDTAVSLYKESCGHNSLVELLFTSSSFSEAVTRYDLYAKMQTYYADQARGYAREEEELEGKRSQLESMKREIESRVAEAKLAADDAKRELLQAKHVDGAKYHQAQGNGVNCGATSFTVGLNILLNEERYPDNVKVWAGPGFKRDSTNNLALRAKAWLIANNLSDKVGVEELKGDIHKTSELRAQLEKGNVVIISSGPGSVWQRADGTKTKASAFPGGHWIVFYNYDDGIYYANDSSVKAAKGAGCPYNEKQMQQWLDGRGNHFATIMYLK